MAKTNTLPDGAYVERLAPDGDYDSYRLCFGDFGIPFRVRADSAREEVNRRALRIFAKLFGNANE